MQLSPAGQTLPQLPQSDRSVLRFTQAQPQSDSPGWQTSVQLQTPCWQTSFGPQALPQPPQSWESVCGSMQLPEQRSWPEGQLVPVHCPATQEPWVQITPQPPQLSGSFSRFEQSWKPKSLQRTSGGRQAQAPFEHCWPMGQALKQPPQLPGSVWRFAQLPPQFVSGGWQLVAHWPFVQTAPDGQTLLQPPQLPGSVWVIVQTPPQLVWPGLQAQAPFWQTPLWQMLPQLPQL